MTLEEYCKGLKLCYDCKMGAFAHKSPSKFECRFKMLHTGPDWKKDPRTKSGTAATSVCGLKLPVYEALSY